MEWVRLTDICRPKQWKTISGKDLLSEGYPVYGANGVIGYWSDYNHEFETVTIACRGTCGTVNIVPAKSYINGNAMCLDDLSDSFNYKFIYYCLRGYDFKKIITGTTIPQITIEGLKKVKLPFLSLDRQEEVIRLFETVDKIISSRKKEVSLLDELIKARFVEMFGDMILNPHNWEKVPLGSVCDVRDGTHDSPKYHTEGYPLVTSKNVTAGRIDFTGCSLICEEDYKKINERSKVDFGDILMPMIGTIGNPVIVDTEAEFAIKNVALIKFHEDSRVINSFVKALLQSDYFDKAVISKIRGGTQKFIALGDIRKLEVCLPPIETQMGFQSFVEQVDKSGFI